MRKKKESVNSIKLTLFLVITILLISFGFYGFQIAFTPNVLVEKDSKVIIIPNEATFSDVQKLLHEGKYTHDIVSFSFIAKLMKYHENIKPGRYKLESNMTNIQAIRHLRAGERSPVQITFNNVRLIEELPAKITKKLMINEDEFMGALTNYLNTNKRGFNAQNIISLFIPNTYEVYFSTSAKDLIHRMEKEYDSFWNVNRKNKAKELGFTPQQIATIASIVQAESIKTDEKARIAGLYINRLKQNMLLQADPTVKFAVGDFTLKRVYEKHTAVDHPYNTYKYKGLPPGPINMPSINSLESVLNAEKHDYIYMCAKEDFSGYHNFASNYNDHLVNARKYQRALTIEQRKAKQLN